MLASSVDQIAGPVDHQRNIHAVLLTKAALDFLFFHEYGHIINGHVDLIGHLKKDFSINEITSNANAADSLFFQTLEMDADSFAIASSIRVLQNINQGNFIEQIPKEQRSFYTGFESGIENFLFSSHSLFRLFGYKTYSPEEIVTYDHPPEGIRQQFIFSLLATMFLGHKDLQKLLNLVPQTIDNVEKAFEEISESSLSRSPIIDAFSPWYKQHHLSIMMNWNTIRPQLEPYAYNKLAPLDESW